MLVWRFSTAALKPQPCACRSVYKALKITTRMPGDMTIKTSGGLAVFLWLAQTVRRVLNDKVCRYCMMSPSTLPISSVSHSQLEMH
jgi:hypothetical protein